MKKIFLFLTVCLFVMGNSVFAQQNINQTDAQGERHGIWKKYFPDSQQVRYEGEFDHGKEIGTFKFYCETCGTQPMVIKEFDADTSIAMVRYYTKKGKLVSEGQMLGKKHIGDWVYYFEKSNDVMTRERYEDGLLSGNKSTYYLNGQLAESVQYEQGALNGVALYYAPNGTLLKRLNYENDLLVGPAMYYDTKGEPKIKGQYKANKKDGVWYYFKNGQLEKEETFPKPLPAIKQ